MIFTYKNFELPIIEETVVNVLKIENPKLFRDFQRDIQMALLGNEESFLLSNQNKALKMSKEVELITSLWDFDFQDRKLLKEFGRQLESDIREKGQENELLTLWLGMEEIIQGYLVEDSFITLEEEVSLENVLKQIQLSFKDDFSLPIVERLINYLLIKRKYSDKKLFVFQSLYSSFSDCDMLDIIHMAELEDICILFLEGRGSDITIFKDARYLTIDSDYCEILVHEP